MTILILYEDEDVIVLDKPSGVIVNRAASVKGETVQDWAEEKIQRLKDPKTQIADNTNFQLFKERSGIVHRLDKDTSGILLIAKNPEALVNLLGQFKNRTVKKEYTALVHGKVSPEKGTINVPIGRLPWRRGLFGVMPGGRHAVTHYSVINHYTKEKEQFTLLSLRIETGRTHQIRVHLQYISHPVVGDIFYAGRKRTRDSRVWCQRLFLHASRVMFSQPTSGKSITIENTLPEELQNVISALCS